MPRHGCNMLRMYTNNRGADCEYLAENDEDEIRSAGVPVRMWPKLS